MTGTRTIAYLHEPDGNYLGSPSDTTYKIPGKNPSVEDLSIENALQRMRYPDDPQTLDSIAQQFEGAIGLSWTQTEPWYLNHVYGDPPTAGGETSAPYTYTWTFTPNLIQSSRWFMGLNHASGTVERSIKGAVFPQLQFQISVGEEVRVTATGFYGDEQYNTSVTPGSLHGKSAPPMVFHGGSLEIPNSTTIVKPQEATLEINTGGRAQRAWQRKPIDAVIGNVETSLNLSKIITGGSQLTLAYGNSTAPSTSGVDGAATGTLRFESDGTPALEHQLTRVTPNSYNWQDLANRDADVLEDIQYNVDEIQTVAESDESTAL